MPDNSASLTLPRVGSSSRARRRPIKPPRKPTRKEALSLAWTATLLVLSVVLAVAGNYASIFSAVGLVYILQAQLRVLWVDPSPAIDAYVQKRALLGIAFLLIGGALSFVPGAST